MTSNPVLASLSEEQKNLVYSVREIFPAFDTTDSVKLCKRCKWNPEIVNSTLAESNSSFGDSKWKAIDRTSRRKKKDGEKTNFNEDGLNYTVGGKKKKGAFNRRARRGKNFDRKGRGKPKDRKGRDSKKRNIPQSESSNHAKHLIQRTNAVTNTSAGSWAAKARAPPRPLPRPNPSPQRDPSSKSGKENEVSNSSSEHIGPPPGIITTSVWTNVHNHDEPEPEVNHAEQYPDFFDSEQFNTQNHLVEPENKMYAGENLPSFQDTQIYSAPKFLGSDVKTELNPPAFQIDHDRRSSASQYSRPIENIESTGVEFRIGTEVPEYNIPGEPFVPETHQFQFGVGDITTHHLPNAPNTQDSRSRPVSDNSSAVGAPTPFNIHSNKIGVTMPPVNMMFPNPRLVLPPEQEHMKANGLAIYQFGVDFSEERKMESNEHHHPHPHNPFPPHIRGDPTQQILQRSGRMDYAERPPYQRAEVSHEMSRTVNVNRNSHELNLPSHQVDSRFSSRLEASPLNQHANFEDIGPSIMAPSREPHGRPPLTHHRLESQFEERKSNHHIDNDESRNPNRINNFQPVHMAPTRSFNRPDNIRSVPAEVPEPFFSEAKRSGDQSNRGFEELPPNDFQPNHHAHYVPNQPQTFKPKPNTGFKEEAGYVQSAYGVEQLHQNLEGDKPNGPSPTPPLDSQYNHGPTMVNTNTEYKQQHHHVPAYTTNQITYAYPHVPTYTTPVQTYQPQTYAAAPRTAVYPYSTVGVYPQYSQPVGVYSVR